MASWFLDHMEHLYLNLWQPAIPRYSSLRLISNLSQICWAVLEIQRYTHLSETIFECLGEKMKFRHFSKTSMSFSDGKKESHCFMVEMAAWAYTRGRSRLNLEVLDFWIFLAIYFLYFTSWAPFLVINFEILENFPNLPGFFVEKCPRFLPQIRKNHIWRTLVAGSTTCDT